MATERSKGLAVVVGDVLSKVSRMDQLAQPVPNESLRPAQLLRLRRRGGPLLFGG